VSRKYVLLYESSDDVMTTAPLHFAAHTAHGNAFHDRGELLLYGPFADPSEGAMAVFTTRQAAEAFVRDDPFVQHGVVRAYVIREWNEAFSA
jgi:uncharacterized protein